MTVRSSHRVPRRHRATILRKQRKHRRMLFESLEQRNLLATIAWDGGPTGLGTAWNAAQNWAGDVLPGPGDDALIGAEFADVTIVTDQNQTVNSVISHAHLTISSGNFVIGDENTDISNFHGDLLLAGGNLRGVGTVKLAGSTTWESGQMLDAGTTQIEPGATLTISAVNPVFQNERRLENYGTVQLSGGSLNTSATIVNHPDAVFDIMADVNLGYFNGTLQNNGTLRKSAGSGTSVIVSYLTNTGTVDVASGTLKLSRGSNSTGDFLLADATTLRFENDYQTPPHQITLGADNQIAGSGTLQVFSANLTIEGDGLLDVSDVEHLAGELYLNLPVTVPRVTLEGGKLRGTGTLTVTESMDWTGGEMWDPGTTRIEPDATLTVTPPSPTTAVTMRDGRTLDNFGTVRMMEGILVASSPIVNHADALFEFAGDADVGHSTGTFQNQGIIRKSAGNGTGSIHSLLNNSGTVELVSGTLRLTGGGNSTGDFLLGDDTTLSFAFAFYTSPHIVTLGSDNQIAGNGTLLVAGETLTIEGDGLLDVDAIRQTSGELFLNLPVTVPSITLEGGKLRGTGTVTVTNAMLWTGGEIWDAGTTRIEPDATLTVMPPSPTTAVTMRDGRTLDNFGTVRMMEGILVASSPIVNHADALFEFAGDADVGHSTGTFQNLGLVRKSAGAGTGTIRSYLSHSGTVEVESGTLSLSGGGNSTGDFLLADDTTLSFDFAFYTSPHHVTLGTDNRIVGNGTLQVAGEDLTIDGDGLLDVDAIKQTSGKLYLNLPVTVPSITLEGGELRGTGTVTVTNAMLWTGGEIWDAAVTQIGPDATLTVTPLSQSTYVSTRDGRTLENFGTIRVSGGSLFVPDAFINRAGALLELAGDGTLGDPRGSLLNEGTIRKTAGAGQSFIRSAFDNPGTLEVLAGYLRLDKSHENFTISDTTSLDQGTWIVSTAETQIPSTLNFWQVPTINDVAATVVMDGNDARILADLDDLLSDLRTITDTGSVSLGSGHELTLSPGDLVNDGSLAVGTAARLAVDGQYVQTEDARLTIGLGGAPESDDFGQVSVSGSAQLDGTFEVRLENGFGPTEGQTYTAVTYSDRNGDFTAIEGPVLGRESAFHVDRLDTEVVITADVTAGDLELAPNSIVVPSTVQAGEVATIEYTVNNVTATDAEGDWLDSLYLSRDSVLDANDRLITRHLHEGGVAGLSSYTETVEVAMPGGVEGEYRVIVVADSRGAIPDSDRSNNRGISTATLDLEVTPLNLGETVSLTIRPEEFRYFRLDVPPATIVEVAADVKHAAHADVYLRFGELPTRSQFDERALSSPIVNIDQHRLPITERAGTWYVMLYGRERADNIQTIELTAREAELTVYRSDPVAAANIGVTTAELHGLGFTPNTTLELVTTSGDVFPVDQVNYRDPTSLLFSFDFDGFDEGAYALRLRTTESQFDHPFSVYEGGEPGELVFEILTPEAVRIGPDSFANFPVLYRNVGDTDVLSVPTMLTSGNTELFAWPDLRIDDLDCYEEVAPWGCFREAYAAINAPRHMLEQDNTQGMQVGKLPPGAAGEYSYKFVTQQESPSPPKPLLQFDLKTPVDDFEKSIDSQFIRQRAQPAYVPSDAWDVISENFYEMYGTTQGELLKSMSDAAAYLMEIGTPAERLDADTLLSFMVSRASNDLGSKVLAAATDAVAGTPGLPLSFSRYFQQSIASRFRMGGTEVLGRGWTHSYGYSIADSDINQYRPEESSFILFQTPTGYRLFSKRLEPTALRRLDLTTLQWEYFYQEVGGAAIYQPSKNTIIEPDGVMLKFGQDDGKLYSISDQNGNIVTLEYTESNLTGIAHSNGDRFTLEYNEAGLLSKLIDHAGRETTYTYDAENEHLLQVSGTYGDFAYEYDTSDTRRQHALTSVTRPDESQVEYGYDDRGWLTSFMVPDVLPITVTYDQGRITFDDGLNPPATTFYNESGQLARMVDKTGEMSSIAYADNGTVSKLIEPGGFTTILEHTGKGTLSSTIYPDGTSVDYDIEGVIEAEFGSFFSQMRPIKRMTPYRLMDIKDELGRTTAFDYDELANLTQVLYVDGTAELFKEYDGQGNLTEYVNRRGQTLEMTYNHRGQITQFDRADGTQDTYTYDDRGNLITASGANGTITFTYDQADRLVLAQYPNGRSLAYTYNDQQQLARLEDHDGNATQYSYENGRLTELRDENDSLIVQYTYDDLGRMTREDFGNGTFTTYAFDARNQVTSILHHGPGGGVISQFDYSYDALGRKTQVVTTDGTWDYAYDSRSQLVAAQFNSTNSQLPDRTFHYEYDDAGNRTKTIIDDDVTDYGVNDRNQYTFVDGQEYAYDADGNLLAIGGSESYEYNDLGQLIRVTKGGDEWRYEYDALGNRIATIHNGQRTEYLVDVVGLSDVLAEYDANGNLIASYAHGLGVEAQSDANGDWAYYQFDALGSTVGLTGSDGTYLNRYRYTPYGGSHGDTVESRANPFQYVGQLGVMNDASNSDLLFMRARYYSAEEGRFISEDPIRHKGGLNLYRYANNQPTNLADPSGLDPVIATVIVDVGYLADLIVANAVTAAEVELLAGSAQAAAAAETIAALETAATAEVATLAAAEGSAVASTTGGFILFELMVAMVALPAAAVGGYVVGSALVDAFPALGSAPADFFCDLFDCDSTKELEASGTRVVASFDPNDITGPNGYGPEHFKPSDYPFPYNYGIRFENLDEATAPAQRVVVTHQLSDHLDWETFELGNFGFGDLEVDVPKGRSFYNTRIDATDTLGVYVDFTAGVDPETGEVTWELIALDPATMDMPINPLVGFLPPNKTSPEGEGHVNYWIETKPDLPDGTTINAQASIVFDTNEAIETNVYVNRIDAAAPASAVAELPATTSEENFVVGWGGTDGDGSGIAAYDVYVSTDAGPFELWLEGTSDESAEFTGSAGRSYAFYTIATDNVGRRELQPAAADTSIEVETDFPWHNSTLPVDVNDNQLVSPLDVLLVIRYLNERGSGVLPEPSGEDAPPPYYDVSADSLISPLDALLVIRHLNDSAGGEAEPAGVATVIETQDEPTALGVSIGFAQPLAEHYESTGPRHNSSARTLDMISSDLMDAVPTGSLNPSPKNRDTEIARWLEDDEDLEEVLDLLVDAPLQIGTATF